MANVNKNILKNYQTLLTSHFNLKIIEDVYKGDHGNGIESYYESCVEYYNTRVTKYGYKKLNEGENGTKRGVSMTGHLLDCMNSFRKDKLYYNIFFVEDKKNKDFVPVISVFGYKYGLLCSMVTFRNAEGVITVSPLIYFQKTARIFNKLYRHISLNW